MNSQAPMFSGSSCSHTTSRTRGVAGEHLAKRGARERIELLDAADRDVLGRGAAFAADQVDVDLAAAQHEALDRLRPLTRLRIVDDRLEAPFGQLARRRGDRGMPQQALRRQDEERQRIALQQRGLAAQQVEVLRGRRAVHEPQVDVGGRLQNALGPRARVLRALALVAVRQQEARATASVPTWRGRR